MGGSVWSPGIGMWGNIYIYRGFPTTYMEKDESRFEKTVMYILHHIFVKEMCIVHTFCIQKNVNI